MLSLAVVICSLACHNVMCKAPIYSAACPGAPPDAGLPMARAHPPRGAGHHLFNFSAIKLFVFNVLAWRYNLSRDRLSFKFFLSPRRFLSPPQVSLPLATESTVYFVDEAGE